MLILLLGVLIWAFSHLMKRVTPDLRANLGDSRAKVLVTVLSFVAIVLMVMGYRSADIVQVWYPPVFMRHINNLLMVVAVLLLNLGFNRGRLRALMRHPMLAAVKTWALAHLLVNGDLASIILFGGLLAWAVLDMILINKMEPDWTRPAKGPLLNDVIYVLASAALFAAIVFVHGRLGYWPLG